MTDFGLQQHGKRLTVDSSEPRINEHLTNIIKLSDDASMYLAMFLLSIAMSKKVIVPCQKCLKDAALQFIDLGNAMNELVDLCEKK